MKASLIRKLLLTALISLPVSLKPIPVIVAIPATLPAAALTATKIITATGVIAGCAYSFIASWLKQNAKESNQETHNKSALRSAYAGDPDDPNDPNNNKKKQHKKKKTLDDILKDAQPGETTKGKTQQYVKKGGFIQANRDFDSLEPEQVQTREGGVRTGVLPSGESINVRPSSTHGSATIEIIKKNNRRVKIRYLEG